jgi:hypothetical protein
MSRRSVMTPRARKMAMKREMLAEIARLQQMAARLLAEFDEPIPGADQGVVIEGHISGNEIVVDDPPAPTRRTRTT